MPACAACGSTTLVPHMAPPDIVRCLACGHMQLARLPDVVDLAGTHGPAAGDAASARIALERIERQVRPGALLDVAPRAGFLLAEARERGWRTLEAEPSELATGHYEHEHEVDVVVMQDLIEHIPDAAGALDRVARLLRPGGVLYLALPNAGSRLARRMGPRWRSVAPTHVQYFTRPSLFTLLRRRDFQPLWAGSAPARPGTVRAPDFRDRMGVIARGPAI